MSLVEGLLKLVGSARASLVGLDREAAAEAFGNILYNMRFNADQIRFIAPTGPDDAFGE